MGELDGLKLLRALEHGVGAKTGAAFFPHLVRALARILNASCAFASEINTGSYEAQVLAYWHEGVFREPFTYGLSGTPCECVLDNEIVAFPRNIQTMFPKERDWLGKLGAQSFLAIPLCDENVRVRGHLAVLDVRERDWSEVDYEIIRIFSTRAGAELERRAYEQQLENSNSACQRSNATLRREVAARLETEEQLARAKEAAEAASQAKSTFLAHMSHELRTPLNGVLGYAQLLERDSTLTPEQVESVRVITRSGEHLLMLINDLLDLAKIEAGRLDLHARSFELPQLLKHVVDVTGVRASQAGIGFEYQFSPAVPDLLLGDERAIRQILLNLLGNAVKFTEHGGVVFRVAAERIKDDRCRIRFAIEDTGPGISPADLQRIFEPFERSTRTTHIEGTGLGLAITRRLVDAMGGTLEVSSELGKGSLFSVILDLEQGQSSADIPRSKENAAAPQPDLTRSGAGLAQHSVDPQVASDLYDLAMKGDVKELLARTETAAAADAANAATYLELQRLARNFDMKGVRQALRRSNALGFDSES